MDKTPFSPREKSIINLYINKYKNAERVEHGQLGRMISEIQLINPWRSTATIRTKFRNELNKLQGKPSFWKSKHQKEKIIIQKCKINSPSNLLSQALKVAMDILPQVVEEVNMMKDSLKSEITLWKERAIRAEVLVEEYKTLLQEAAKVREASISYTNSHKSFLAKHPEVVL